MTPGVLNPDDPWSDRILADLKTLPRENADAWGRLLQHARSIASTKLTKKWLKGVSELLKPLPPEQFDELLAGWLEAVEQTSRQPAPVDLLSPWLLSPWVEEPNATTLRGLLWFCTARPSARLCTAVAALATGAYRKVPGIGPQSIKLGNAALLVLGEMAVPAALTQLAILKTRIKLPTALKTIDKALTTSAEKLGIDRSEIEELSAPTCGLEEVGFRRITWDPWIAEVRVQNSRVELSWKRSDGKAQKSIPAAVRNEHAAELKELQTQIKEIGKMVPAQSARIETCYLQQKSWNFDTWRERYLDHPLIGTIARRLIWKFTQGDREASAIFHAGALVDARGRTIDWLDASARVTLWHPLGGALEEITAWRDWMLAQEIRQPFKQAYREIYLLTDAERNTETYSNRFAAHILRQHQFHALCVARGWKNTLRLLVDADYAPAGIQLPAWGLRAEFWIESAGDEINDAGVYRYLVTDQVRFYSAQAAANRAHAFGGGYAATGPARPIPLDLIPPIVFSEVMRDIDLFVGVSSVGNDPNWFDGGPQGHHVEYWQRYSFGELGATAQTRKAVLESLIPRLKIADRCSFSERFLIVRGDLRTYKIHLGSGNILMEPNDQYLCIVPSQTSEKTGEKMFLPFEGDQVLSVILSKALLLAADQTITDSTITSQIRM